METTNKVNSKTHTGANFTNKGLLIEKVLKKQNVLKWIALLGAFLFQAIPYGVASNILGNMQPFVVGQAASASGPATGIFAGNFVLFTLVFTFGSIISAIFTPLLGRLFGRVNLKVLLGVGCVVSGGAFAMLGLLGTIFDPSVAEASQSVYAQRAAWLYSWYGICLIGSSVFSGLGVPFIVGSWFPGKNRGTVLGIAFAGGSAGNLIWQVAINQTLKSISVWNAFYIYGAISAIAGLLISVLLINSPKIFRINSASQTLGATTQLTKEQDIQMNGAGVKTTLTVPWFYVLCLSYGIFALGTAAAASQWPTFLRSGLLDVAIKHSGSTGSEEQIKETLGAYFANAATIIGLVYGVACLAGNLAGGYIYSKLGVAKAFIIGGTLRSIGAIAMLLGVFNPVLVAIGVGISGFTCYTYTSGSGFMSTNLFGRKDSSVVIGFLGIAFAIGFAISTPLISGIQGDASTITSSVAGIQMRGNWLGVWIFTAVITLIGSLLVSVSASKIHKMGYLGMTNANYSRYGMLIGKYSAPVFFKALKIWVSGNDKRLSTTYLELMNKKVKEWDSKKQSLIDKENKKYVEIVNKFDQKSKLAAQKANEALSAIQKEISEITISKEEQEKIDAKVAKLNAKVAKLEAKISKEYNELIQKLINENKTLNNQDISNLITCLENDTEIQVADYDNKYVIKYFVKYAASMMYIQQTQSKISVAQNPKLALLTKKEKKAQNKVNAVAYNTTFKSTRNQKAHEQILAFYENKYSIINQMIDEHVTTFNTRKQNEYKLRIAKTQAKITKDQSLIDKYQTRFDNISNMWNSNEIHSEIIKENNTTTSQN